MVRLFYLTMNIDIEFIRVRRKLINKPFDRLEPKKRAVFVLHLAGFTQRQIRQLLVTGMNFVTNSIKEGYREYTIHFNNKFE